MRSSAFDHSPVLNRLLSNQRSGEDLYGMVGALKVILLLRISFFLCVAERSLKCKSSDKRESRRETFISKTEAQPIQIENVFKEAYELSR